jgi:hypothetical protein
MATAVKRKLSGSTSGKPILIAATSTAGTAVHTCPNLDGAGQWEEIWLWAQNNHTADVVLTVEFGSADAKDNIIVTIPTKAGLVPVVPGFILQDEMTVKAFAGTTNVISIHGFVNTITD